MLEVWLNTLFALIILGSITFLANISDTQRSLRLVLYLSILGLNGVLILFPLMVMLAPESDSVSTTEYIGASVLGCLAALGCTLFLLHPVRQWAARFFPKAPPHFSEFPLINVLRGDLIETHPLDAPQTAHGGFRPESMMHMWAWIAVVYFTAFQLMSFFLGGGLSGIAEDMQIDYSTLLANFVPQIVIPVLGVGLFIRRDWRSTLRRLGLGPLTLKSTLVAFGSTAGLVFMVFIVSSIWALLVSEETYRAQTEASDALAESIDSFGLALMVALTAGIGEEIAFRGALQPIFGFWFTAVVFVISHTQYTLTPAALIILIVAIAFGLIRNHFNTTAAILTHFLYNFTLLLLTLAAEEVTWLHLLR